MDGTPNRFTVWAHWQLASMFCNDTVMYDLEPALARHASARLTSRFADDALHMRSWGAWQRFLADAILTNPHTNPDTRTAVWDLAYTHLDTYPPTGPMTHRGQFAGYALPDIPDSHDSWTRLAETLHRVADTHPDLFSEAQAQKAQALLFLNRLNA